MFKVTENQMREWQRQAFDNRDSIALRDRVSMECKEADVTHCSFELPGGAILTFTQPRGLADNKPMRLVTRGEHVVFSCVGIRLACNGLGRAVNYDFFSERLYQSVTISGHEAQALHKVSRYCWD